MDILILSIFTIVVILSFMEDYMQSWQKVLILMTIGIALIAIATFKPMSTTDARTYEYYFYDNDNLIVELATEPTYIHLSRLILSFGGEVVVLFFIYALIAIPLKFTALWRTAPYIFTAMIVYIGIYYPLQDVVQIRCGVASGFLLWALVPLSKRQYLKAIILTIIATLFHYSSLAFIPILLVGNIKITRYWKYILGVTIPICLALYLVNIGAVSLIPESVIEGKLDLYKETSERGGWEEYVPYKQIPFLAEFTLLYIFLYFYDTIEKHCEYAPIIVKILVFEMTCMIVFAEIPVLGARLHELFGIFNVIAYTCCMYCIKPKYVVRIGLALFCLIFYFIQMNTHPYFG